MARVNTLNDFLTDVASAIKTKKGSEVAIPAASFDTEILALPSQGTYEQRVLNISKNGTQTITPSAGFDAIDELELTVAVPEKQLQSKTYNFTQNTTIQLLPDTGYDGFDIVTLNIEVPSEEINNQDKEITENGVYTADEGYTGLGTVTVNVPQTGDVPVKLFETEEQMQADTTAKEGDLAIVYRSEIQNATVDSKFQVANFPETVVLDSAITDYIDIRYRAVDSSVMFDCWGMIDSSRFRMNCYSDSGEVRIEYTSSDGITYTRTDTTGNPVDFGTEIYYERAERWNDAIGKFIQIGGNKFEGLFNYKLGVFNYSACLLSELTVLNNKLHRGATYILVDKDKINTAISNAISYMKSEMNMTFSGGDAGTVLMKDADTLVFIFGANNTIPDGGRRLELTIDTNTNTVTGLCTSDSFNGCMLVEFDIHTGAYIKHTFDTLETTLSGHKATTKYNQYYLLSYYNSDSKKLQPSMYCMTGASTGNRYGNVYEYESSKYIFAGTQLTLNNANELLPDVIAYGKNGIVEGDGSIYNNLNYRDIIGSYIPAYTFVSTLGDDNGKKLVHSNNINNNGIWKTTVISKENNGFGYNFGDRFENSAGTVLTATKNYIITVEKIIGDNNDSRRIWNIYDKHGSLLYSFTQNTNVDKRWATIFAIELTDGRLLYASYNWNEAWSGSGGSQTITSGYINTKNSSHTEVNYTWSGEQFMPEGIWYDGTDYYIGVASWSNNLIVLKNGKLWVNAKSTDNPNYYGGYICGDDTYIYMTAGTDTTPIIVVNKQTKAVSVINSSAFDSKRAYIGYDTDTNKCYVTANKKLYSLSGTSTRVIATLTRNIAISSIFRYKNINGKVLCISNYGAYQCNVTDDISTTYSLERFSGYDDCYNDTYIIETQDSDNVYISQLLCGVTTDSGSINDKFLAFNTKKSPINNKANTYMILSNEIDDYTPYTISQEEYNTALGTADEILGEEV